MFRINLKGRFTPAAVTAAAALAVAGTGSAVAGSLIDSGDIRNNSITRADIRDGTLSGKDMKKSTLGVGHLKESARAALKGQTGPMGPQGIQGIQGAKGDKGDQGPAGPASVTYRHAASGAVANGTVGAAAAACQPGEKLIGGGGGWTGQNQVLGTQYDSTSQLSVNGPGQGTATLGYPLAKDGETPAVWHVKGTNTSGGDRTLRAYAVCAA